MSELTDILEQIETLNFTQTEKPTLNHSASMTSANSLPNYCWYDGKENDNENTSSNDENCYYYCSSRMQKNTPVQRHMSSHLDDTCKRKSKPISIQQQGDKTTQRTLQLCDEVIDEYAVLNSMPTQLSSLKSTVISLDQCIANGDSSSSGCTSNSRLM